MRDFFLNNYSVITKSVELIAAIAGSYYLKRNKNSVLKIFVYFLWLTFFVELIGEYARFMRDNYDYEWFIAIKNSVFCTNTWLFNIYSFFTIGLLGVFYSGLLRKQSFKLLIRAIVIFYSVFSICYFTFTDAFFEFGLPYDDILASIIVSIYVICYFIELINSEYILYYYKLPSFYISVALLLWYLCVTPLFIFNGYFLEVNTDFVIFRYLLLLFINVCAYLFISFGFWYSLKKTKQ